MCHPSSDEHSHGIGRQPGNNQEEPMYTNDALKAEVDYRRERLSRDFRRPRTTGTRRHRIHLFSRKA